MTKLFVSNITSDDVVEFKDIISASGAKQYLDTFGVIKANKNSIDEDVTIPLGTNGFSAGTITVGAGVSVTVKGEWRVL